MKINVKEIEGALRKLKKKDAALFRAVQKKILQISRLNAEETEYFKNLRAPLQQYKRVHVGSFVLLFRIEKDTVFFGAFGHHDDVYKRPAPR